ncbi:DUF3326 domain-containing protein [filamentous cyanobacterium LEGE 11480]|uniref:DUF3326 domain-containing protein n=1 Tax=Romeriopsis navalis LEGE 11480 TaxID=2777977 RepID=A0A928VTI4_9CYAN|nr:DUF3326 domain-containing protein [Romeriopsis navalis]MBE9032771.1 DUF3326 domain-containing protein [Romeriopsis navalis LEGE 11480]
MLNSPYTVGVIVPTGVGAAIGGYAGDALPVVKAISHIADRVITHPNVMNGASLYWNLPNALYVEGFGLDQFAANRWGLEPVRHNRIGLLIDQGIEQTLRWRHLQVADAARATLGLDLTDYVVTDEPLQVELRTAESGATWGTIGNPDSLLRAAGRLIDTAGATAIAVIVRFPEDQEATALQAYRHGQGVDPLAGAEAVISHLIVRQFQIPCAHAPALSPLPLDTEISPRSAAEELGHTFLPCVLAGLSRAPQFTTQPQQGIWANALDAIVIPASCCGGSAILSLSQTKTQIITVEENTTRMQVYPRDLGIHTVPVRSYLEAIGAIVSHRAGITAQSLQATIEPIQPLSRDS